MGNIVDSCGSYIIYFPLLNILNLLYYKYMYVGFESHVICINFALLYRFKSSMSHISFLFRLIHQFGIFFLFVYLTIDIITSMRLFWNFDSGVQIDRCVWFCGVEDSSAGVQKQRRRWRPSPIHMCGCQTTKVNIFINIYFRSPPLQNM